MSRLADLSIVGAASVPSRQAIRQPFSKQRLAIDTQEIRSLLNRVHSICDACDLDLMLFFHRHPRTLLSNDSLTAFVGYDREKIAQSLERLIAGGLLKQIRGPSNTVNLHVLERGGLALETLERLLDFAYTGNGRGCVMRLLAAPSKRAHMDGVHQSASLIN